MPSNTSQITPPRVPITDERTGAVSREWYRWFYNIFTITGGGLGITPVINGGTGLATIPTNGQLLIGNGAGYTLNTLGAGQNISVTNGAGTVVVSITGQVPVVNGGTGASTPAGARANLSAAVLGANDDITSMSALTGGISTPTFIQMNTTPVVVSGIGKMVWNATDQTLDIGMDYGVVQQVGQETYARVQNSTGLTIPNGTVVGFAGAGVDDTLEVAPYLADGATPTLYVLGVMTHDFPDAGAKGYCTTFGYVRDVDTSAFAVGDVLYASPTVAGGLTKVKPTAPNNVVPVAAVLHVSATVGIIFVRPTIEQQRYYGEFTKTNSQSPAVINTAYALLITTAQIANGVSIGATTSQIYIANAGLYNITTSVQITSTNASQKSVWVWLRLNGTTNFPNSARIASIALNNGYVVVTLSEVASLAAGDFFEVMYASDSTNISIATVAATAFAPAAPAVVLAVTQTEQ
jgi:hypothetical protein